MMFGSHDDNNLVQSPARANKKRKPSCPAEEGSHSSSEDRHSASEGRISASEGRISASEDRQSASEGRISASEGRHAASEGLHSEVEARLGDLEDQMLEATSALDAMALGSERSEPLFVVKGSALRQDAESAPLMKRILLSMLTQEPQTALELRRLAASKGYPYSVQHVKRALYSYQDPPPHCKDVAGKKQPAWAMSKAQPVQ